MENATLYAEVQRKTEELLLSNERLERDVAERTAGGPTSFQFRPLGPGDCQKCHRGEFSRPFDWDQFWPHIRHGKEPKA